MKYTAVKPPSRKQLFILRSMIVIGVVCMGFFMDSLLKDAVVGYRPIYWMLIATFIYTFFKIIYEWYHYWSISVPETPPITRQYTVDIFTTFCAGEPYEMIVETLTAIQAITYPHQTYLCDEANDPYLKSVCDELGVHHVTRTIKINAKAGNINNALSQSSGELCVVLDPDHIPVPHFLDPVVSHFDNPEIGYVQVVQAYYNQDIGWIAKGAAQQTYQFYGPMMMCMNTYGTVQAIGANCTFRRTALESIGGHAAGLAEDMHTAMQLHAKKWKSVYVPEVLTRGLVPATLSAYYKQQIKWSRGVFELLVTSYVKLFTKFTWRQKLHYGLLPFFYLSGFVFLFNFLIPIISLFGDVYPLQMDFSAFLVISVPFITAVVLIRHYVQQWVMEDNERGFHLVGGLLLIGTWWVFILGFIYTIIRKDVPYIATPKDVKDEKNLKNNLPNIAVLVISIIAIFYGLYNDWNPFTFFMAGIVSLNCLFMIFMLVASSELKLQEYARHRPILFNTIGRLKAAKKQFWLLRRRVYTGVRTINLMLLVFIICLTLYTARNSDDTPATYSQSYFQSFKSLFTIKKKFVENSEYDAALPRLKNQAEYKQIAALLAPPKKPVADTSVAVNRYTSGVLKPRYFTTARGVIYSKGHYWYKNAFALTKKTINSDFVEMRNAGINTVKVYGPNVYDSSTLDAAKEQGVQINYSFWIPEPPAFVDDADNLAELAKTIVKTVRKNRSNSSIGAWNIGNSPLQQLNDFYQKPYLAYAQYNYIKWLKQLVDDIKQADTRRVVTIDVVASPTLGPAIKVLHEQIPKIDAFSLIVPDTAALKYITANINANYFFGNTSSAVFTDTGVPAGGIFYANWQDQQSGANVMFDGLKDIWGRNKPALFSISKSWGGNVPPNNLPPVKIMRPALTTTAGASLPYNALVYMYDKWNLAAYTKTDLNFEWYLVKTDGKGHYTSFSSIAKGPRAYVNVPANMSAYRLYVVASRGNNVTDATSILNIPLDVKNAISEAKKK